MTDLEIYTLRYPIGKYEPVTLLTENLKDQLIGNIADLPYLLKINLETISLDEYKYTYRPEGWSINQVIHHLADSHVNAFIRFKLALTEDNPTIKPYDEGLFVQQADCTLELAEESLALITHAHKKWLALLEAMSLDDFNRTYYHPGYQNTQTLAYVLGMYSWHGFHHLAHIKYAIDKKTVHW
jgi:hypothetical protein